MIDMSRLTENINDPKSFFKQCLALQHSSNGLWYFNVFNIFNIIRFSHMSSNNSLPYFWLNFCLFSLSFLAFVGFNWHVRLVWAFCWLFWYICRVVLNFVALGVGWEFWRWDFSRLSWYARNHFYYIERFTESCEILLVRIYFTFSNIIINWHYYILR